METFFRTALLEAAESEIAEAGLARLSFASELKVRRYSKKYGEYWELLSHAPGDANLGLLNSQGVVLENHDDEREIGEVVKGSARVDADRKTRATIRVDDARWEKRMASRDIRGVSVGYNLISVVGTDGSMNGIPILRFSWRPYEISLLTVQPADESVGIGRSKSMKKNSPLETLLEMALSGSRKTDQPEEAFTRESCRNYSLHSVLSHLSRRGSAYPADNTFEREIHDAGEKSFRGMAGGTFVPFAALLPQRRDNDFRDMQATIYAAGGAAVPSDMHPAIELLYNRVVCIPLGCNVITGLRGNYLAPREETSLAPVMVSEIAGAPAGAIVLDQVGVAPLRATIQVPVSLQLLKQTNGQAEEIIRRSIRKSLAVIVDRLCLFGQGGNDEPLGLFNAPGIGAVAFGGAATWPNILLFEQNISLQNADGENLGWAISPKTRDKWKQASRIAATNFPSMIMEGGRVNDYPALASNQMAAQDQVIFGNWPDFSLLIWADGIDLMLDAVTQASNGKAIITAHLWFNTVTEHPQAFCVSSDGGNQ